MTTDRNRYPHGLSAALLLCAGLWIAAPALAGSLDATGGSSYSLEDLYNRLNAGSAGTASGYSGPAAGPTAGTMHTVNEIMGAAPSVDDSNGAAPGQVLSGKTFWGLRSDGTWGTTTGTLTNNGAGTTITPSDSDQSINAGYWSSATTVQGDADLTADNIKKDTVIFGVTGTYETSACGCDSGNITNGRWCDNGDGTETDLLGATVSGRSQMGRCLVWLKTGDCRALLAGVDKNSPTLKWLDAVVWSGAVKDGACGLSDGSLEGEWYLPTKVQLQALTTNSAAGSDARKLSAVYWTSTTKSANSDEAWHTWGTGLKTQWNWVLPVRSGP